MGLAMLIPSFSFERCCKLIDSSIEMQISLRWIYEQGVIFLIKSFNPERMRQNLDIFDWSLTEEELNKINQIPQHKHGSLSILTSEPNDIIAEIDAELSFQ